METIGRLLKAPAASFFLWGPRGAGKSTWTRLALVRNLHPFMAAELGPSFDVEKALTFGMLPLVWNAPQSEEVLKAYAALYVREEVQTEGLPPSQVLPL